MIEQIAFDAVSSGYTATSISHTGASDITLAVAGARLNGSGAFTATYGGVSMTATQSLLNVPDSRRATLFYLENPLTGTQTFEVSGVPVTSGFFWAMTFKLASYLDDIDRVFDYSGSNENTHPITLNPVSRKCWLICWARSSNSNTSYTIDIGTQRLTIQSGVVWNTINTLEVANLASQTFTASNNPTYDGIHEMIGVEIHPKNKRGLII